LLREPDEVAAFMIDEALAMRLDIADLSAQHNAKLPRGMRYATEDEYEPLQDGPVADPHPELRAIA
jgi:hypothetical protein